MIITAGIDPGLSGAIAFYSPEGPYLDVYDMPTVKVERNGKNKSDVDYRKLGGIFGKYGKSHVFVEKVGAMPGQGVSSMFSFGKATGAVLGACGAQRWHIHEVPPATWKKSLQLTGQEKDAARLLAIETFPLSANVFARKKDCGRADAALIALYGSATMKYPLVTADQAVNYVKCPCWATGQFAWVEGCAGHPWCP